jgi:hypothetical protein
MRRRQRLPWSAIESMQAGLQERPAGLGGGIDSRLSGPTPSLSGEEIHARPPFLCRRAAPPRHDALPLRIRRRGRVR